MLSIILKPFSALPLRALHGLGAALGGLLFYCMPKAKKLAIENITQSKLAKNTFYIKHIAQQSFVSLGKAVL
jgi:lauroyl/myristoyl acyltransferase